VAFPVADFDPLGQDKFLHKLVVVVGKEILFYGDPHSFQRCFPDSG